MFGSTRKIRSTVNDFRFDRKIPLFWCKMISVAIFTSNHFRTQTPTEKEREREREREKEEKSRTQKLTPTNPETDFDEPRKPKTELVAPIAPPARSSHHSTNPPKTDRSRLTPKPIVLNPDSLSPIAISPSHRSRSQLQH